MNKLLAEFIGTFWLVLGGCGSAVLAAAFPEHGIHFLGVSLAFGLTVLTMAYAVGGISGGHFNPAVTVGLWFGGRFETKNVAGYVVAQTIGAIVAAGVLYFIVSGKSDFTDVGGFASNGFGEHSPGGFSMAAALVTEIVMTAAFLFIIMAVTNARNGAPAGFAPIAIGLALTLIHLISIPVTNTSVNPARSTGVAMIQQFTSTQPWALGQLWLFWVAPIVGALIGVFLYKKTRGTSALLK
ncbi:MAG: aquaporin Z [Formosimonas sp.]|jgi:aquaporin Z